MQFDQLDWKILDRLRRTFLAESPGGPGYWENLGDLAQYDATFGERIGWKWDAVLRELRLRHWTPPAGADTLVDWGCGSGVAGRRVLAAFPQFRRIRWSDQSTVAMRFASTRSLEVHPGVEATEAGTTALATEPSGFVLVVSHVWNELAEGARKELLGLTERAAAVLWVEPGTHVSARELQAVRDRLVPAFEVAAPCTHQKACGLLVPGMERHWCHHFAPPPPEVFQDAYWSRFAVRAGIDLSALPYSFLVLHRRGEGVDTAPDDGWERVLGGARVYKPEARALSCGAGGVTEVTVPKRTLPDLYKAFKRETAPVLVRWTRKGNVATAVEPAA